MLLKGYEVHGCQTHKKKLEFSMTQSNNFRFKAYEKSEQNAKLKFLPELKSPETIASFNESYATFCIIKLLLNFKR